MNTNSYIENDFYYFETVTASPRDLNQYDTVKVELAFKDTSSKIDPDSVSVIITPENKISINPNKRAFITKVVISHTDYLGDHIRSHAIQKTLADSLEYDNDHLVSLTLECNNVPGDIDFSYLDIIDIPFYLIFQYNLIE